MKCYVIIQDTIGRILEVWGNKNFTMMISAGDWIKTNGSFKGTSVVKRVTHKWNKDEYEITLNVGDLDGKWDSDNI